MRGCGGVGVWVEKVPGGTAVWVALKCRSVGVTVCKGDGVVE